MTDPAVAIAARLAELWRTTRPTIISRLNLLHSALDALTHNPADNEARSQGRDAAHKLSGILGVFGLPEGSRIASEIEGILIQPSDGGPGTLSPSALSSLLGYFADLDAVVGAKK